MTVPVTEKGYASTAGQYWPDEDEKTPELIWPRSIEVYDRMRRQDAQVMSVLRAVTLPIRRTTWRIDPNGAAPEVVKLVSEDLNLAVVGENPRPTGRTRDRFSWVEHIRMALLMLVFGHSMFEQQARIDANGMARLKKLAWRPPKTIAQFDVAEDGGLNAIIQHGMGKDGDRRIDVSRLVAYVSEREGGNWAGQSLLRPAYKFWLLKDRALRTDAQVTDRNGLGLPVYEAGPYPEERDPDTIQREEQELATGAKMAASVRAGDNSGVAIRHQAKLTLQGVQGTLPDALPKIRYYDEQIARAVLAHFLNLGTETGSWALGSTFADFFTLSLQTVAQELADVASQHIVEDLVDWNWGPNEPAPKVTFDEIGSRHPATAEAIQKLIACKAIRPDEPLEQFLRTMHGLPAADPSTAREGVDPGPEAAPQPDQQNPQQQARRLV